MEVVYKRLSSHLQFTFAWNLGERTRAKSLLQANRGYPSCNVGVVQLLLCACIQT